MAQLQTTPLKAWSLSITPHAVGLFPLIYLVWLVLGGRLGVNPVETLSHETGLWALIGLLMSLAVTPLVKLSGFKKIMKWRRTLGLYAFFYACLHLGVYLIFDLSLDFSALAADVIKRPYIAVGFAAFLILLVLAATSSLRARRRLGQCWVTLHRSVYLADALVLLHFYWLIKADYSVMAGYFLMYLVLMAWRIQAWRA